MDGKCGKAAVLLGALLGLLSPASAAGFRDFPGIERQDALADGLDYRALDTLRPAYKLVEGVSDGLFDLMRLRLLSPVFRVNRELSGYRQADTFTVFKHELHKKETRLLRKIIENLPRQDGFVRPGRARSAADRSWIGGEQVSVIVDSLKDAIVDRYQLEQLGLLTRKRASRPRDLDATTLTAGALIGGTFLYLNGIHASAKLGPVRVNVDMRSARSLKAALSGGGDLSRAAGVELGLRDQPLTLSADWDVKAGEMRSTGMGLKYRLQF